jgi:hypothetical protein
MYSSVEILELLAKNNENMMGGTGGLVPYPAGDDPGCYTSSSIEARTEGQGMGFPDPERFTLEDVATRWGKSVDYVKDLTRRKELAIISVLSEWKRGEGRKIGGPIFRSYVEKAVLYDFEGRYGIQVAVHQPHLSRSPYLSDELRIAVEAYTALYVSGKVAQKSGHKELIRRWLKKHHSELSQEALERIATVVNPNKRGGAPKQ